MILVNSTNRKMDAYLCNDGTGNGLVVAMHKQTKKYVTNPLMSMTVRTYSLVSISR